MAHFVPFTCSHALTGDSLLRAHAASGLHTAGGFINITLTAHDPVLHISVSAISPPADQPSNVYDTHRLI